MIKDKEMLEANEQWKTFTDFVLFRVFGRPLSVEDNKFYVKDHSFPPGYKLFNRNDFPYNIPEGNHWIMWYGTHEQPVSDDQITADIDESIASIVHATESYNHRIGRNHTRDDVGNDLHDEYDFAWYCNPKFSVPEFFHVQVFWKSWSNAISAEGADSQTGAGTQ